MALLPYLCLLVVAACTSIHAAPNAGEGLLIENVDRLVDISTQIAKIAETLTIKNTGSSSVSTISYLVDPVLKPHLAFLEAVSESAGASKSNQALTTTKVENSRDAASDDIVYTIQLPSALASGQTTTVKVESVFTHAIKPFPAEVRQQERQLVTFSCNAYSYIPYPSTKQVTRVKLTTGKVESFSRKPEPAAKSSTEIKYGPFDNVAAKSRERISVHYENNKPFLTVTSLERWIEVSHWGNIAVEERFEVVHTGAKVIGEWSRLDYQRGISTPAAVDGFTTILPASARDVYYKDAVGNISTSHLRQSRTSVELELRPRFPLFGGWRTQYFIGYNLPSYEYLYNGPKNYALQIRFIDHVFDNQVIDRAQVKVVLPEGCTNIQVYTPYSIKRMPNELHFTYLDTTGRPVIVLEKDNLVDNHIQTMQITYEFARLTLYKEPLYVVAAVGVLTLFVIIFMRFDFSLSADRKGHDQKLRMASHKETLQGLVKLRAASQRQLLGVFEKFKNTKDVNGLQQSVNKLKTEMDKLHDAMHDVKEKVRAQVNEGVGEKVGDVVRYCRDAWTHLEGLANHTERLLQGKTQRKDYDVQERTTSVKLTEHDEKISTALNSVHSS